MKVVRGYKTALDLNNEQRTACLKHAGVPDLPTIGDWPVNRLRTKRVKNPRLLLTCIRNSALVRKEVYPY